MPRNAEVFHNLRLPMIHSFTHPQYTFDLLDEGLYTHYIHSPRDHQMIPAYRYIFRILGNFLIFPQDWKCFSSQDM